MSSCIIYRLRNRELHSNHCMRKDFCMVKTLICKGNRVYRKISSRKSNKVFCYESGRLFSDNYRECQYGYGINGGPHVSYRMPRSDNYNRTKLEDALIYKCYHDKFHEVDNRACLIALKAREMGESLVQYDLNTGQLIREIYLSHAVKFKYIAWAEMNEMFYVKSVHSAERSRFHMATGISMNIAIVIAAFSAFPLKYVGMLEVDRRVFGAGITNAILTNGMLVVMYITGHVRFFSFDHILEKFKCFEHSLDSANTAQNIHWGDIPLGLPMNIKITECPPALFEVRCADQDVQIGGFPWHYIYSPRGTFGMFEITSLKDHIQAKGGTLRASYMNPDPDNCIFHGDNSGRIIHVSGSTVKVLQLQSEAGGEKRQLQTVCTIDAHKKEQREERSLMTSSGRCVKRRQTVDEISGQDNTLIHHVDYEDELDLTWISVTSPNQPSRVCFYDNQSFELIKEVYLEDTDASDMLYEHNVYVDLDTIVQVTKPRLGQFICNVYRLSGDINQENQSEKPGTSSKYLSSGTRRPRTRIR
ncbi:DDB1- and CUL4-associated factor 17-like [Mercenaria mercenaria]|uniref:DDB1- and CUL4-associated factor 17-like n=1 Tax=Mercenaria mercenaria TaxID=6596 RepID=UPI00234E8561|nr:DDB1- and CUL4-associated factor 17-like [Mercenaria mercenaria]